MPTPARILVAEDDPDLQRAYLTMFRARGHEAEAVADGDVFLARVQDAPPDLVILDLGLPGADGLEILDRMAENPDMQGISIIVVSGREADQNRDRVMAAGADLYLTKPVDYLELVDAVDVSLSLRGGVV